jgi:hypothetical protein
MHVHLVTARRPVRPMIVGDVERDRLAGHDRHVPSNAVKSASEDVRRVPLIGARVIGVPVVQKDPRIVAELSAMADLGAQEVLDEAAADRGVRAFERQPVVSHDVHHAGNRARTVGGRARTAHEIDVVDVAQHGQIVLAERADLSPIVHQPAVHPQQVLVVLVADDPAKTQVRRLRMVPDHLDVRHEDVRQFVQAPRPGRPDVVRIDARHRGRCAPRHDRDGLGRAFDKAGINDGQTGRWRSRRHGIRLPRKLLDRRQSQRQLGNDVAR